ncbi:MAG: hypothetical protein WDN08_02570 [Rhizomicrobium sp.]
MRGMIGLGEIPDVLSLVARDDEQIGVILLLAILRVGHLIEQTLVRRTLLRTGRRRAYQQNGERGAGNGQSDGAARRFFEKSGGQAHGHCEPLSVNPPPVR